MDAIAIYSSSKVETLRHLRCVSLLETPAPCNYDSKFAAPVRVSSRIYLCSISDWERIRSNQTYKFCLCHATGNVMGSCRPWSTFIESDAKCGSPLCRGHCSLVQWESSTHGRSFAAQPPGTSPLETRPGSQKSWIFMVDMSCYSGVLQTVCLCAPFPR